MKIYNTLGRELQTFVPRDEGKVGMYVCGATVQSKPHLGHGRYAVVFDVIRRYFAYLGYDVTYVENITDVDDKIIDAAIAAGVPTQQIVDEAAGAFKAAKGALGIMAADIEPRATEHIPQMIEMIEQLIVGGHAYEAGGDVYFSVRGFPGYGKLSGRNIDDLQSGARVEVGDVKRDPLDFAVWKGAKPGEPSWPSPWGEGRPGWHIECSAMSHEYLGTSFDIHGGGNDLIFPHHENEIAQAEAALDAEPFAHYWMHNGMMTLTGEKMSKSTGHIIDLLEAVEKYPGLAVRLFYLRTHYRKPLDFSEDALADATASLERLWAFRRRQPGPVEDPAHAETIAAFRAAMEDDVDASGGLAALFDAVREGNRRLDAGDSADEYLAAYDEIVAVFGIGEEAKSLDDIAAGLRALADRFEITGREGAEIIDELLVRRSQARADKDWATGDAIRDGLAELGVVVADGADGSAWHRR
ncbi:MAG: cysteine--tRNA ligase [Acidimicrobiia bacterium]|nr:cysteine--tRNA ligase [Acidimicrobiia bacterium]